MKLKFIAEVHVILYLHEDVPVKKAEVTAEGNFFQPSSNHHSFTEVF